MELKKQQICFPIILMLMILFFSKTVFAENEPAENERGICDAWFSKDGINWENTTAKASLKLGQTFYIKVMVKAKVDLKFLRYQMSCYGPPYDFELIEAPSNLPDNSQILQHPTGREIEDIAFSNVKAGDEYNHIWEFRVKPNSTFGGGNTPINLDSFFFDGEDEKQMLFTAVSVSITDELWEYYSGENKHSSSEDIENNTSGLELVIFILSISLTLLLKKKK